DRARGAGYRDVLAHGGAGAANDRLGASFGVRAGLTHRLIPALASAMATLTAAETILRLNRCLSLSFAASPLDCDADPGTSPDVHPPLFPRLRDARAREEARDIARFGQYRPGRGAVCRAGPVRLGRRCARPRAGGEPGAVV